MKSGNNYFLIRFNQREAFSLLPSPPACGTAIVQLLKHSVAPTSFWLSLELLHTAPQLNTNYYNYYYYYDFFS